MNLRSRRPHSLRSSSVPLPMISESFLPCIHSLMTTLGAEATTGDT
ncbi:Uncharacterised protein [Mycobacteroides abscessus subsp. abscessus]|nr:Uncharacterised protein [Mycobacteroides abscessus subsp. abscessus]